MMGLLSSTQTFLRDRFQALDSRTFLIGVSGGPDSMVLLDVLSRLRDEFGYRLCPLHVNYRFHDQSDDAYRLVANVCDQHELVLTALSVLDPEIHRNTREGLEARARAVRFEFFESASGTFESDGLFLAHHRDDQVETVLLNLGRGTGPGGLAGMCPQLERSGMTVYRPFLSHWQEDLEAYLEDRNLEFVRDPTNEDEGFARNQLRHTVIPEWESAQPDPVRAIANLADRVRRENDFWDDYLESILTDWSWPDELQVQRAGFRQQHPAVQLRYLSHWVALLSGSTSGWNEQNLRDVRDLFAEGRSGARVSLPGGFHALNEYDRGCLVSSDFKRSGRLEGPFDPPGDRDWLGVGTIHLRVPEDGPQAHPSTDLTAQQLTDVTVRTWNQGDRLRETGTKVKEVFEENDVPYRARRYWPVLAHHDGILAVPGFFDPSGEEEAAIRLVFCPDHPAFHQLDATYAK